MLPRNRQKLLISPPQSLSRIGTTHTSLSGLLKLEIPDHLIWLTVTLHSFQKAKAKFRLATGHSTLRNSGTPSPSPASGRTGLCLCASSTSDTSQAQIPTKQPGEDGRTGVLPAPAVFHDFLISIPLHVPPLGLRRHAGSDPSSARKLSYFLQSNDSIKATWLTPHASHGRVPARFPRAQRQRSPFLPSAAPSYVTAWALGRALAAHCPSRSPWRPLHLYGASCCPFSDGRRHQHPGKPC